MPYGKTTPVTAYCSTCNTQGYERRRNKNTEKEVFSKYCPSCNAVKEFKPKVTRHSS